VREDGIGDGECVISGGRADYLVTTQYSPDESTT
jgi:hypothetical protein